METSLRHSISLGSGDLPDPFKVERGLKDRCLEQEAVVI